MSNFSNLYCVPVIEYARLVLDCATGVGQQNHDSHVPHHHHEFHFPHYQHIQKTGKLFDHHSLLDYCGPKQLLGNQQAGTFSNCLKLLNSPLKLKYMRYLGKF